jgi:DNA-binding MarR family transcriptional regulator
MNSPKPRRKRGIILTPQGWEKLQRSIRESEIQENFGYRYTLEELGDRTGLDPDTAAKLINRKAPVDKRTLELFFQAFNLELLASDYSNPNSNFGKPEKSIYTRADLSEAVDISFFYGRTAELAQLQQWILQENCRLVALLGMGGIGKTALSVKLAHQIKHKFEYIIWRSLRHALPIKDLLAQLIQFLSHEQVTETDLPESVDGKIAWLIEYLQNYHCLLVLDNLEAILQSGEQAGYYRQGYEGYGELIRRIGEASHQSCLVLTSREKPEELAVLEGEILPVRSLQLTGLQQLAGQEILKAKGVFGTANEIKELIDYYRGNPLALKIVATSIKELFDGNIYEFIAQGTTIFQGIRQLLSQQFNRLSTLEQQILYWLALNREPISITELQDDFILPVAKSRLLEALESLSRRCLIDKCRDAKFRVLTLTLQPVVMEYVSDCLIKQVCVEIADAIWRQGGQGGQGSLPRAQHL